MYAHIRERKISFPFFSARKKNCHRHVNRFGDLPFIAELAERSPIFIQNSSNPSSRKNLDVRHYDPTTAQGATFDMRGQLYRGHANATTLFSSPVVSALGSESDDPGSGPGRDKLCGKKKCELRFWAWLNLYIISCLQSSEKLEKIFSIQ